MKAIARKNTKHNLVNSPDLCDILLDLNMIGHIAENKNISSKSNDTIGYIGDSFHELLEVCHMHFSNVKHMINERSKNQLCGNIIDDDTMSKCRCSTECLTISPIDGAERTRLLDLYLGESLDKQCDDLTWNRTMCEEVKF